MQITDPEYPDLADFKVVYINEREGTAYIGLKSLDHKTTPLVDESKSLYFRDEPFVIVFSYLFRKTCKGYDMTGYGEATPDELKNLIRELELNTKSILSLNSEDDLRKFVNREGNEYFFVQKEPIGLEGVIKYRNRMLEMNKVVYELCEYIKENNQILSIHGL